ncbi:capsular polysaccharide export protein, LipB/KpsS family [Legionella sp. CNM-4043-24]|uniref:capsular polysaccharide export protein, LipB/KpsS family n=1 Tax=Legionella sp. CNM-4043-24 TaxID=3421646 RepID=UPI00403B10D5
MQIVSYCRGDEFSRFATGFVAAINYHSPGQLVHLHVVNPPLSFSEQAALLRQSARAIEISFSTETSLTDNEQDLLPIVLDKLSNADCNTLYLRIDSLVQKDLLIFLNRLHATSIAFSSNMFNAMAPPALWIQPSRATFRFLNKARSQNLKNTADLMRLIKRSRSPLYQDLGQDLVSSQLSDHSVVCCNAEVRPFDNTLGPSLSSERRIAVITRRVDLPFKAGIKYTFNSALRRIHDHTRLFWQYFPKIIRDAHVLNNENAEIICLPHEKITPEFISGLPHEVIYLPHGNKIQFQDDRLFFYMQEIYPFFFTIDRNGWGSTSSHYGKHAYEDIIDCQQAEAFCQEVRQCKTTKYLQQTAPIPPFDVFFPLQIPDDDSLVFGSAYSLRDIVHAVIDWAEQYKIRVLFKCHPIRPSLRYLGMKRRSAWVQFIKAGELHDILSRARVVFVANSSVGFEAMLHFKPIVHFARAIYDVVATAAEPSPQAIQTAYLAALQQSDLKKRYLQFIQWYIFNTGHLVRPPSLSLLIDNQKIKVPVQGYCDEMISYNNLNTLRDIYSSRHDGFLRYAITRFQTIKNLLAQ